MCRRRLRLRKAEGAASKSLKSGKPGNIRRVATQKTSPNVLKRTEQRFDLSVSSPLLGPSPKGRAPAVAPALHPKSPPGRGRPAALSSGDNGASLAGSPRARLTLQFPRQSSWEKAASGRGRGMASTRCAAGLQPRLRGWVAGGGGGRVPRLPGRRRLPSIGRDLASDVEILLIREAPSRHSEADGQKDGSN